MRHLILAAAIAAAIAGMGLAHGRLTDRWSPPPREELAGKGGAAMPLEIGDWRGEPLPRQAEDDGKTAVVNRKYINSAAGRWMLTSVTSGRPGIVSVHNPEHCYLGSGYKLVDAIRAETIDLGDGREARFWTGHFQKKKPTGIESIRIYWGWTADGTWEAPSQPRLLFALKPRLHKLYMIHPVPTGAEAEDAAPYRAFMSRYVAELSRRLGP
jgi:hypothetical protein